MNALRPQPPVVISRRHLVLVLGLLACCGGQAWGFGDTGHETVGAIADRLIVGTPAAAHVKALLGTETLEHAATWADKVREGLAGQAGEDYKAHNPDQDKAHFTDVPLTLTSYKEGTPGTSSADVVHTINRCIAVLKGGQDAITPKEALKVLVHLVGDIHQPLHVGAAYFDATGSFAVPKNEAQVKAEEMHGSNYVIFRGKNLHSYWDGTTVTNAMARVNAKTPREFAAKLTKTAPTGLKTSGSITKWSTAWANEMLPLSLKAHTELVYGPLATVTTKSHGKPVTHLSRKASSPDNDAYDAWSAGVVKDNLAKAGYRLAAILTSIWKS